MNLRSDRARDVEQLRATLEAHDPRDPREVNAHQLTLVRLGRGDDPFDEHASPEHLTGSAFVISPRGVVLHRHKRLNLWLQPGGHIDPGESASQAAQREALEETGLSGELDERLFHVDVHPGPRGHTHYDLRYLIVTDGRDPEPGPNESPDAAWFDLESALAVAEPSLHVVLRRLFASDLLREVRD